MISIIIPVYNVEKYLARCLDSILNQSYSDFEIILIDDGSKDASGKICDLYSAKEPRITVFHIENSGASIARNIGLDNAHGDYICFVDSDDYIHPNYLQTLLAIIEENTADISMCNFINVDSCGQEIGESPKSFSFEKKIYSPFEISKEVYGDNFVPYVVIWNKLYSKRIWNILRYTEKIHCEDDAIIQKIYHLANKIVFLDVPLYYYFHNDSGIMHTPKWNTANLIDDMYGLYLHSLFLAELGEKKSAQEAFHCYFANGIQVLTDLKQQDCVSTLGETITYKHFFNKLNLHYKEAKKEIHINLKRKIYYTIFLLFPSFIIWLRKKIKSR